MNNIQKAKLILTQENLSCVLVKGDTTYKSQKRGVTPIIELINKNTDLSGFSVADKIVGKAAAMLFILLNVKEIYSPVMSESAIEVLKKSEIKFSFLRSVPYIVNRTCDGQCPMEKAVIDTQDPHEALKKIQDKIFELSKGNK